MLALINAKLIDGTGAQPLENAVILVKDGRFEAVGRDISIPEDASVLNLEGKTVIPGLSDMHTHMGGSSTFNHSACGNREETYDYVEAREGFLRWGVTTVRTCGDQYEEMLPFRDDANSGKVVSPRVIACGPFVQCPEGHPWGTVYMRDPIVAEKACVFADQDMSIEEQVDQIAGTGADFIKVFYAHINKMDYPNSVPRITKDQLKRIVDRAHQNGLKCACHVDGPSEMMDAADVHVDFIEHMIGAGGDEAEFTDEMIGKVKASGAVVTPTMVSIERFDKTPGFISVWEDLKKAVKQFYDAGIPMMAGCDSGVPFVPFGESLHDELAMLAESGIPNDALIKMATLDNMTYVGLDEELGSIEPGKKADMIVLGSDPLEDIANTKDIRLVFKDGKAVYDAM